MRNLIAELDPLNDAFRHHVLYGEEDGDRGGHAFSSTRIGKTVFPERWSEEEIFNAALFVLENPIVFKQLGDRAWLIAIYDEVVVEVRLGISSRGYQLKTAFPHSGEGVFRNTAYGREPLPLDKSILEA